MRLGGAQLKEHQAHWVSFDLCASANRKHDRESEIRLCEVFWGIDEEVIYCEVVRSLSNESLHSDA